MSFTNLQYDYRGNVGVRMILEVGRSHEVCLSVFLL